MITADRLLVLGKASDLMRSVETSLALIREGCVAITNRDREIPEVERMELLKVCSPAMDAIIRAEDRANTAAAKLWDMRAKLIREVRELEEASR